MGKRIAGCLGVLASIAGILGLLVALNIIHPFSSPLPTPTPSITPTPRITPIPPTLTVPKMRLNAQNTADCPSRNYVGPSSIPSYTIYTCYEFLNNSGQGSLWWSVSGWGPGVRISFSPQRGQLGPSQSIQVTVTIAVTYRTCPTVYLNFTQETSPTRAFPVTWSCS